MIYNNRNYPHPVLGISDDFKTEDTFAVDLSVKSDQNNIQISPIFILKNAVLKSLIDSHSFTYIAHVYCRGTMFREIIKSQKSLYDPILISSTKLNGEVEIDFLICALENVTNYENEDFNEEYGKSKFQIERGDIVAYGGKARFFANKAPEELKSISSIMNIDCSGKHKEPMRLDYKGEKITLLLCEEDYQNYRLLKSNSANVPMILSGLVFPGLMSALHFLNDETSKDFQNNAWYKALTDIVEMSKESDPLIIAQRILDLPILKTFNSLINSIENE